MMESLKLSPEAIENDNKLSVPKVKMKEIFIDHDFNCRGRVSPADCIELARDISKRGLYQPITLREIRSEGKPGFPPEPHLLERGYKYKILAGHRRFVAYRILSAEQIPCVIKDGYITEFEEKDINAIENLQRTELNMEQECQAIRHYWAARWSREEISERVGKSPGWVQIRCMLLEMPKEIRVLAGQGYLTNNEIREIYREPGSENKIKMAVLLRDRKKRGDKSPITKIKRRDKPSTKKIRTKHEIIQVLLEVQDVLKKADRESVVGVDDIITFGGNSFATRAMSWCAGEITTLDFYTSLSELAKALRIPYVIPELEGDVILR